MNPSVPCVLCSPPRQSTLFSPDCACPDTSFALLPVFPQSPSPDCACADQPLNLTFSSAASSLFPNNAPASATALFSLTPQLYTASLPHNFSLAIGPFSPIGPIVLNPAAQHRLQTFTTPQPLQHAVDYTLAQHALLLPADRPPTLNWGHPQTLTAWIHVTNACNLNCPYCYVRKSNACISIENGFKAVDAAFYTAATEGFKTVKLKYAGGEAALHFKLLQLLHHYAQEKAQQTGIDLQAVILSNGTTWTASMAGWLKANRVTLMVSVDGTGAAHDVQRPTLNGQGSFARIEHIIDHILIPNSISPVISITITGKNATATAETVNWAIDRQLSFSLNFYRQTDAAGNNPDLDFEDAAIITGMQNAYAVIQDRLPDYPLLDGLLDRVQSRAHTHTCGIGQNYLVFTHTGTLATCQMHLDTSTPYNAQQNLIPLVAHRHPPISVEDKPACQTCPWRYRCSGGCPLQTLRATGRFDRQNPNCNIYTALYPQALYLEGLRILKTNGMLRNG